MSETARAIGDVTLTRFRERVAERERGVPHRANGEGETATQGTFLRAATRAECATIASVAQEIAHAVARDDVDEIGLHDDSPAKNSWGAATDKKAPA